MAQDREFGMIGLGKIGGGLALHALDQDIRVVGMSGGGVARDLVEAGPVEIAAASDFHAPLQPPRAILLYIPAGPAVDAVLADLGPALEPGDTVVDGGNSYWGDSIRRHRILREKGLHFIDAGASGGLRGAHLVGPHVDEVINLFALAIRKGLTAADLQSAIFAYPTGASDIASML